MDFNLDVSREICPVSWLPKPPMTRVLRGWVGWEGFLPPEVQAWLLSPEKLTVLRAAATQHRRGVPREMSQQPGRLKSH
jgi:hypothetical protein